MKRQCISNYTGCLCSLHPPPHKFWTNELPGIFIYYQKSSFLWYQKISLFVKKIGGGKGCSKIWSTNLNRVKHRFKSLCKGGIMVLLGGLCKLNINPDQNGSLSTLPSRFTFMGNQFRLTRNRIDQVHL